MDSNDEIKIEEAALEIGMLRLEVIKLRRQLATTQVAPMAAREASAAEGADREARPTE